MHCRCECFVPLGVLSRPDNTGPAARKLLIELARLKLAPADLGAINDGTGREVVVFVDPDCEHCRALYADLPSLTDRYRFRLVALTFSLN